VTQMYLADFFETRFTDIMEFATNSTASTFVLLQPFLVNYTSTAIFTTTNGNSTTRAVAVPPVLELDLVLDAAFTGENLAAYINLLQGLPPENIFRTTSNVTFNVDPVVKDDSGSSLRSSNQNGNSGNSAGNAKLTGGIVAGAAVFLLAMISVMAAVRQKAHSNGVPHIVDTGRDLQKRDTNDNEGHMTVAGDTYMAESTVISGGTFSLLSNRRQRNRSRWNRNTPTANTELVVRPSTPIGTTTDESQSLTLPSIASRSDWGPLSVRRNVSEIGSDDGSDDEIYEANDRLMRFHSQQPEPAYRGALLNDVNERGKDVLAMRDDMRLPRHFAEQDDIPNNMNTDGDDNDSLSVDDDVPLRVIDLIRKFTPSRRCSSR
jgi:hypothetical protein